MAKRTLMTHAKLGRLCRFIKKPRYQAVGILEILWHTTAEHQPDGAIGRWSDADIADVMGWEGEAEELIKGLVDAGFIDKCPSYRLVIHDWQVHADRAVKQKLGRNKREFVCTRCECIDAQCIHAVSVYTTHTPPIGSPPEPEPEPEPNTETPQTPQGAEVPNSKANDEERILKKWVEVRQQARSQLNLNLQPDDRVYGSAIKAISQLVIGEGRITVETLLVLMDLALEDASIEGFSWGRQILADLHVLVRNRDKILNHDAFDVTERLRRERAASGLLREPEINAGSFAMQIYLTHNELFDESYPGLRSKVEDWLREHDREDDIQQITKA